MTQSDKWLPIHNIIVNLVYDAVKSGDDMHIMRIHEAEQAILTELERREKESEIIGFRKGAEATRNLVLSKVDELKGGSNE